MIRSAKASEACVGNALPAEWSNWRPFAIILVVLAVCSFSIATAASAVPPTANAKERTDDIRYQALLYASGMGQMERRKVSSKLLSLSKSETIRFIAVSKVWLASETRRSQVVRSYITLTKRPDFDKSIATLMLNALDEVGTPLATSPNSTSGIPNFRQEIEDVNEQSLHVVLSGKAGALTLARIDSEVDSMSVESKSSAVRLARLGKLVDAMSEAGLKPSTKQLEKLLQNDVYEIRVLSVQWFRLSPPDTIDEQSRFIAKALSTNPRQVQEQALRALSTWTHDQLLVLKENGDPLAKCSREAPVEEVRAACAVFLQK